MANQFHRQGSTDGFSGLTLNGSLRREGFQAVPVTEVDDFQLRGRLWELIYALSGKGVYLRDTNHLSDRDLYAMIAARVLCLPASEPSGESPVLQTLRLYEVDPAQASQLWLQFYADQQSRERWAAEFPGQALPAKMEPPFDRDRWLPIPPLRFCDPLFEEEPEEGSEAALREQEEQEEFEALDASFDPIYPDTSEPEDSEPPGDAPELYCEDWQRPIDVIQQEHGSLIPPAELTDETITPKLWELLHNLACRGYYMLHTDHLDDRELYSELCHHGLREEAILTGRSRNGGWFHDLVGNGSEEHTRLWLRYYATDKERESFRREYPGTQMPAREKPKARRDWRLPQGPF